MSKERPAAGPSEPHWTAASLDGRTIAPPGQAVNDPAGQAEDEVLRLVER